MTESFDDEIKKVIVEKVNSKVRSLFNEFREESKRLSTS